MGGKHRESATGVESNVGFDGLHYELVNDDWQSRAVRLQDQRWRLLQRAVTKFRPTDRD